MNKNGISSILSAAMLIIYSVLMIFGVFMGVCDFAHKSYIVALLFAFGLLTLYMLFIDRLPVIQNVWVLTALCLILNGVWCIYYIPVQSGDYDTFLRYATLLAFGNGTAQLKYVELFPHIFGYSYFLNFFLRLAGNGYGSVGAAVNVILTTGSGLIIWAIVRDFCGKRKAAVAYLLWILCPSKLLYNVFCLSEPYYTFLILVFFLIIEKVSLSKGKYIWLCGLPAGAVLRLIQTARPIALIPVIALLIYLIFLKGYKKVFVPFVILMLAVYIPTGSLWNSFMESKLLAKPASSVPGYNIYVGLDSEHGGTFCEEDMEKLLNYYYGGGDDASDAQGHMLNDALEMLRNGEVDFKSLIPAKFRSLLGSDEGGAFYSKSDFPDKWFSVASLASNVWYYFVVLLSLCGAYSLIKRRELNVLQFAPLYVIGLILAQMAVEVSGRYHYSIIPMLIILACVWDKKADISVH